MGGERRTSGQIHLNLPRSVIRIHAARSSAGYRRGRTRRLRAADPWRPHASLSSSSAYSASSSCFVPWSATTSRTHFNGSCSLSVPRVVDPCCANMGHWPRAGNSTLTFFLGPLEFVGTHYTLQYYYRLFIALRAGTHQGASFQYIFLGALA